MTHDGPQVNYLESLFLPIFAGLQARNVSFDVLQFRWGDKAGEDRIRQACDARGIGYRAAPVWRWGGAIGPLLSAVLGGRHVRAAARAFGSDIIMPRSLMPAISVLVAGGRKLRPLLFDADGLAIDERVDVAGLPPTGLTYRILRDVEAQTVRHAASILVRTRRAAEILFHRAGPPVTIDRFHVVTNGRDERVFQPFDPETRATVRLELGVDEGCPLLVYAGSMGPQYRPDLMEALFTEVRRRSPDARLLVLTGSPERAGDAFRETSEGVIIMRVAPDEVPRYLAASDVGLAYRLASFSMQGVAPVKHSEYLLCGLPVIGTAVVGDTKATVEEGLFFDEQNGPTRAAEWLVERVLPRRAQLREQARAIGMAQFSLRRSVEDYCRAIRAFRADEAGIGRSSGRSSEELISGGTQGYRPPPSDH